MAKWHGYIGFAENVEATPGIWEEVITEKEIYGEIMRNRNIEKREEQINMSPILSMQLRIILNPYIKNNIQNIRYIVYSPKINDENTRWKITDVEIQYPSVLLTIGGVYTG